MTPEHLPSAAPSLARLIQELNKLPGIGPKSAQRLAYFIIRLPEEEAYDLANAISAVKQSIMFCHQCQNLTDASPCSVCANDRRNREQICVVEEPMDVLALERTHCYRGLYHVLHGVLSPLNGVGPDQIKLRELFARLSDGEVKEVVIATNPTLEGEATAMYISRHLAGADVKSDSPGPGVARGRFPGIHRRIDAEPGLSGPAVGRVERQR